MNHDKTFQAISKLQDIEVELHRLKNALELFNKAVDSKREWVELTPDDVAECILAVPDDVKGDDVPLFYAYAVEAKLREKNT